MTHDEFFQRFFPHLRGILIDGYATRRLHAHDLHMTQEQMFEELKRVMEQIYAALTNRACLYASDEQIKSINVEIARLSISPQWLAKNLEQAYEVRDIKSLSPENAEKVLANLRARVHDPNRNNGSSAPTEQGAKQ
jgi:hypothetical protein